MTAYPRGLLVLLVIASACAWGQATAPGPAAAAAAGPDPESLPDDAYGRLARYGKALTERTFAFLGPEVADPAMRFAGNNLACGSCHELAGTKPHAMPWTGVYARFPQYRPREDEIGTLEERINGCMERSMAGRPLPYGSREMKAFLTYMHFLSRDVPTGNNVPGQGLPPFTAPDRRADPAAGSVVYQSKCSVCHGADGAGQRAGAVGSASGYLFPPLWGPDTFSDGAGLNRLLMAAAFVKTNMPQGTQHGQPQLSDAEAYDVAAFVLSQPRPSRPGLDRDFPARWNKPVDAAFPPYVDGASADQHKYGPFGPLQQNMKALRPATSR